MVIVRAVAAVAFVIGVSLIGYWWAEAHHRKINRRSDVESWIRGELADGRLHSYTALFGAMPETVGHHEMQSALRRMVGRKALLARGFGSLTSSYYARPMTINDAVDADFARHRKMTLEEAEEAIGKLR